MNIFLSIRYMWSYVSKWFGSRKWWMNVWYSRCLYAICREETLLLKVSGLDTVVLFISLCNHSGHPLTSLSLSVLPHGSPFMFNLSASWIQCENPPYPWPGRQTIGESLQRGVWTPWSEPNLGLSEKFYRKGLLHLCHANPCDHEPSPRVHVCAHFLAIADAIPPGIS